MPGEELAPRRRGPHPFALALIVVVAAVLIGTAGRLAGGTQLLDLAGPLAEPAGKLRPWAVALGAPWLAVAWAIGALARRPAPAVAAGALVLAGGTWAWYALTVWTLGRRGLAYAMPVALWWTVAAVAAGAAFGLAGALWRSSPVGWARALGVAVLAGALIGEAMLLQFLWDGRAARVVLTAEVLAGVLAPALLLRRARDLLPLALVLTAVIAVAAAGAEHVVREALRDVGWGGR
ncbi:MAG TPA: DUF6518 family protein [Capillimicrobium sp.]|jgi:hypothetical protein